MIDSQTGVPSSRLDGQTLRSDQGEAAAVEPNHGPHVGGRGTVVSETGRFSRVLGRERWDENKGSGTVRILNRLTCLLSAPYGGGEGGIRTRSPPVDSVTYRNHVAVAATCASVAVAPCTPLHQTTSVQVRRAIARGKPAAPRQPLLPTPRRMIRATRSRLYRAPAGLARRPARPVRGRHRSTRG